MIIQPSYLQSQLLSGERILWQGRPKHGIVFQPSDIYLIPFSILWGGFAISSVTRSWSFNNDLYFSLFDIVFFTVACYLIAGRFLHDAYNRTHLFYAVTNQRVIVRKTGMNRGIRSLDLAALPTLELKSGRNGRGTISFDFDDEDGFTMRAMGFGALVPTLGRKVKFFDIPEVNSVYETIRRAIDELPR